MKLKSGLVLRRIAGENIVLTSAGTELKNMITLNDTACTLWRRLEQEAEVADLAAALLAEYDVDPETAAAHAEAFAAKMKELDLIV